MSAIVIWALVNGIITGGVGVAIVLIGRQRRMERHLPQVMDELERRLEDLDRTERHVAELEERLSFAERLLAEGRRPEQLPPGGQPSG